MPVQVTIFTSPEADKVIEKYQKKWSTNKMITILKIIEEYGKINKR